MEDGTVISQVALQQLRPYGNQALLIISIFDYQLVSPVAIKRRHLMSWLSPTGLPLVETKVWCSTSLVIKRGFHQTMFAARILFE